jgi:hypothetical protein
MHFLRAGLTLANDLIRDISLDVLEQLGDDREARYEFFKQFVEWARTVVKTAASKH